MHFYREGLAKLPDFELYILGTFRSKILDKHLRILAAKHIETKFITGSVDRLKFLVGFQIFRNVKFFVL